MVIQKSGISWLSTTISFKKSHPQQLPFLLLISGDRRLRGLLFDHPHHVQLWTISNWKWQQAGGFRPFSMYLVFPAVTGWKKNEESWLRIAARTSHLQGCATIFTHSEKPTSNQGNVLVVDFHNPLSGIHRFFGVEILLLPHNFYSSLGDLEMCDVWDVVFARHPKRLAPPTLFTLCRHFKKCWTAGCSHHTCHRCMCISQ